MKYTDVFVAYPKTTRNQVGMRITEKIDGTNALVAVDEDGTVRAGSRSRWITPEDDNFGFAAFVAENSTALAELGPGLHYGEWYGGKIQRGYGLTTKRLALFRSFELPIPLALHESVSVAPELYIGGYDHTEIQKVMDALRAGGSRAAPGFMDPEGVVVEVLGRVGKFKVTYKEKGR